MLEGYLDPRCKAILVVLTCGREHGADSAAAGSTGGGGGSFFFFALISRALNSEWRAHLLQHASARLYWETHLFRAQIYRSLADSSLSKHNEGAHASILSA
jgi:hypothetical protein